MTTDMFLFRDGYSLSEKINRIPTARITPETPEIDGQLDHLSMDEGEVKRIGKNDFFEEVSDDLDGDDYQHFVSDLFETYGVTGDKFNMQLFTVEESLSHDNLVGNCETHQEQRIEEAFSSLDSPIVLTDHRVNDTSVDIQFRTTAHLEDIEPDEKIPIQIIDTETGETVKNYGPDYKIKAPARYRVEARIYTDLGIIAVSNYSKIGDGLQTDIAETVTEMARSGTESGIGKTSRLELNEIELLLLLQEMEGDISGLGYTIEIAGVDTADYTGQRDEDMVDTDIVQAADEAGNIRKIKFYVDHPHDDEGERDVMLRIFDDGHLTTSKPVPPELLDVIIEQIDNIRDYNEFLTPLNEILRSYIRDKFRGKSTPMRESHNRQTHIAFNNLIEEYFEKENTPTEELQLYKSMIVNIGIRLCDSGISEAANVDGVSEVDEFYDHEGKIQECFEDYTRRVLQKRADIDYDELSNHLDHLLRQNWDSPIEIIEYSIQKYDLQR